MPLPVALLLVAGTITMGHARQSPAARARRVDVAPVGRPGTPARVLPYRIGYPAAWQAEGSIFGAIRWPTGVYYDADIFSKRGVASIQVQGEGLPPGSLLTSMCYREQELLDFQRAEEGGASLTYTATRGGAIAVDGTRAYLLGHDPDHRDPVGRARAGVEDGARHLLGES